jgi:hypothetical protein
MPAATACYEDDREEEARTMPVSSGHRVNLTRMGGDRAAILFPVLSRAASKRV